MISFTEFLTEARSAPLYHAVKSGGTLFDILKTGFLLPHTSHTLPDLSGNMWDPLKAYSGISTTRDIRFAKRWAPFGGILQLDQQKLANNHKIKPIDYWKGTSGALWKPQYIPSEHEEFILTRKPLSTQRFVTKVLIDKNNKYGLNDVEEIADMRGIPVEYY